MAQVSFDIANEIEMSRQQNQTGAFSFFSLRNDGDEAIVRFKYDNTSQFQIFTVHDVNLSINNRETTRKVSCLRNPRDPIDMCPLCKAGKSSRNVFLIQMLQYVIDPNTNAVSVKPVIWERSMTYANRIKSLIDEYGPLSDCIFKIKRCGAAGSRDTTYEIYYGNPKMYPENIFVKDFSVFDNFKLLGTVIMDKSYEDINVYLTTGSFPQDRKVESAENDSYNNLSNETTQRQYIAKDQVYQPQYVPVQQPPQFNQSVEYSRMPPNLQNMSMPNNANAPDVPPQRAVRYY